MLNASVIFRSARSVRSTDFAYRSGCCLVRRRLPFRGNCTSGYWSGEGGIRTRGGVAPTPAFQAGALNQLSHLPVQSISQTSGGSGIRTHGRVAPTPVFETGTLNRSVIPPLVSTSCGGANLRSDIFPKHIVLKERCSKCGMAGC